MKNVEKENQDLKNQISSKNELNDKLQKRINELEIENENLSQPVCLRCLLDSVPIKDATNIISDLQFQLAIRIKKRKEIMKNEVGMLKIYDKILKDNSEKIFKGELYQN